MPLDDVPTTLPTSPPSAAQPDPHAGECVVCFVERMTSTAGCDGTLRWVRAWRDRVAPSARALERRLQDRGGYCDCEVLWNIWFHRAGEPAGLGGDPADEEDPVVPDGDLHDDPGADRPPGVRCAGVPPRSTQPCANWLPWRAGRR